MILYSSYLFLFPIHAVKSRVLHLKERAFAQEYGKFSCYSERIQLVVEEGDLIVLLSWIT
ncbi:hypothetical protein AS219_02415 [Neorickettsia sp. 179522]|nr:hypothetical protein AS219_02415 [Neorickettsia sp. 179522]